MSRFPSPRNIRRGWRPSEIALAEARAELDLRFPVPARYGEAVEARAWTARYGWQRGLRKRIDIAFETEGCFASVRFHKDGRVIIRLGSLGVAQ